ncbi:hypothetical protein EA004_27865, partial [Vibrio anguillarum]|nr:hypothetical protein [Vibrio anguillarum]
MNIKILNELSLLNTALSVDYFNYLTSAAKPLVHKIHIQPVLNIYAAYCFLIEQGNYTAFKVLNDSQAFNSHFQLLVGFIYDCDD